VTAVETHGKERERDMDAERDPGGDPLVPRIKIDVPDSASLGLAGRQIAEHLAELNTPAAEMMANLSKVAKARLDLAGATNRSNLESLKRAVLGPALDVQHIRLQDNMHESMRRKARVPIETRDALLELNEQIAKMRRDEAVRDAAARRRDVWMLALTAAILVFTALLVIDVLL
jgi:hypothetical protein